MECRLKVEMAEQGMEANVERRVDQDQEQTNRRGRNYVKQEDPDEVSWAEWPDGSEKQRQQQQHEYNQPKNQLLDQAEKRLDGLPDEAVGRDSKTWAMTRRGYE